MKQNESIRINRYLALCGLGSRRACENLVRRGEILIDSESCTDLGKKINPSQNSVSYQGKPLQLPPTKVYYILNKPKGYLSSTRTQGSKVSKTVYDLLRDIPERVFYTGRLDKDSEGLMLFTNDGYLAYQIQNPRFHIPKTYLVTMQGFFHNTEKQALESGIRLPLIQETQTIQTTKRIQATKRNAKRNAMKKTLSTTTAATTTIPPTIPTLSSTLSSIRTPSSIKTLPCKIKILSRSETDSTIEITIYEGKKRQIRRMLTLFQHPVLKLKRERIATLILGHLPPGKSRMLSHKEIQKLKAFLQTKQNPSQKTYKKDKIGIFKTKSDDTSTRSFP